jgi:hypothetical protein
MRTFIALAVLLAPLAFAQAPNTRALEGAGADFTAAQAAAAAAASRSGDQSLSCEQLQAEFVGLAQTPAFQSFALQQGANAAVANNIVGAGLAAVQAANVGGIAPQPGAAPAEEAPKKGGFLKKLGKAGQIAGAAGGLAGGLGGRGGLGAAGTISQAAQVAGVVGGGAGDAASVLSTAGTVANVAGVLGGGGGGLGNVASTVGIASAVTGLAGGGGGLGNVANTVAIANTVTGVAGGGGAGVDTAAITAAGLAGTNLALSQITAIQGVAPELMRGARLLELGKAKTCPWSAGL